MSEFEPFDEELAGALRRRAGSTGATDVLATDAAHRHVLARASGIRRRRAAIAGAGSLAVLVAAGFLIVPGGNDDSLAPASVPSTTVPVDTIERTTVAPDTTLQPTTPDSSIQTPSTITSTTVVTVPGIDPGPTLAPPPVTVPATDPALPPTTTLPEATSTTVAGSPGTAPFTQTYNSTGGSITVTWNGSTLSLGAVDPAAGYASEIEDNEPLRIRVRFRGDGDSRIEIRAENGVVTSDIEN